MFGHLRTPSDALRPESRHVRSVRQARHHLAAGSARTATTAPSDIDDILQSLAGQHIPGGCDDCDAYQTVHSQDGIHVINV
jgi:hypothetical protein